MPKTYRVVITLLAALALGACNGTAAPEPQTPTTAAPTTSTATTEATSPTSEPVTSTPPTEEDLAGQAVIDMWARIDLLAANPGRELTELAEVARGQALEQHRSLLFQDAANGRSRIGDVVVLPTSVQAASEADRFIVTACLDVSGVDVLDSEGNSVVLPGRPDRVAYDYTVEKTPDGWFVIEDLLEGKDC